MALFSFKKKEDVTSVTPEMESFLNGFSIEVMPRTAEKVENFRSTPMRMLLIQKI